MNHVLIGKNVDVLLIDEIGSVGQQLLSEIDHALRITKERPDAWFGGMIVIFAGDFISMLQCQKVHCINLFQIP